MKKLFLPLFLLTSALCQAQVFFQESFESDMGWTLSHTFDNGNNKFAKRDISTNFNGLEFLLVNPDGNFVIGVENTDANVVGAPEDGIVTVNLDPITITGRSNLQCVLSIAVNDNDQSYDDRDLPMGDFIDIEIRIDNGNWMPIGWMDAEELSEGNSPLFHDANFNGNGGEIGEPYLNSSFQDIVLPINSTGNTLELRVRMKMTESTEEAVIDNIRLRENVLDDTAPTVNHTQQLGDQVIQVFFNEPMAANTNTNAFFTGIPNLASVVLSDDNLIATLSYSVPLVVGVEYNLVIFGPSDLSGNSMATPYLKSFYYNPEQPNLVITEIMYNEPNNADTLEFIEVYNNENMAVQLGGFILTGDIEYTFPTSTLEAGAYVLIARKPNPATNFYSTSFGNYSGSLPNSDGIIILRNTIGQNIDIVHYYSNLPWPPEGSGQGHSITLNNPNSNNNIGSNWIGSSVGTGLVNGEPVFASPGMGEVTPNPVIQFATNTYSINETDGSFEVVMYRSIGNNMASSVNVSIATGTSGSANDISLAGNETITFAANDPDTKTITMQVTNDTELEGFEFLTLNLTANTNASLGSFATTDILIHDDEFSAPTLFINELQSNNTADTVDEASQHEDWFEIYNPNPFAVDIAGYYLTDNAQNFTKYRIVHNSNATVIQPNAWLLFWADEDKSQGSLHTNFKLSSLGEFLALRAPDGLTVLDQIAFPPLSPNVSYGRAMDGDANWITFNNTTPFASNQPTGIEVYQLESFIVYPNPTNDWIRWEDPRDVTLFNQLGEIVKEKIETRQIDLSHLPVGIYYLKSPSSIFRPIKIIKL